MKFRAGVTLIALCCAASEARGQEEGIGPAPSEARAVVARALQAMGGREAVAALQVAVMSVDPAGGELRERHTLVVPRRLMHYGSRRPSGAGFDVVLGGQGGFLCDRDKEGRATYVEDLAPDDVLEGGYERDVLFMPLLLHGLLDQRARMDYRGRNTAGEEVVRALIEAPAGGEGRPFTIRLRFDAKTGLLAAAMGVVPWGQDKGKKRYCEYHDYAPVEGGSGIMLPTRLADQRGSDEHPRTFRVRWTIDPKLPPDLFARPEVSERE